MSDKANSSISCSAIIINYNTFELTIAAVKSLIEFCAKYPLEVIVVDNGSEKEDFLSLVKGLREIDNEQLKIVRSRINTGFGAGNMLGVQEASGKYYAFINSDTLQEMDSLGVMLDFIEANENTGIVGGLAVSEDGKIYKKFLHGLGLRAELLSSGLLNFISPKKFPPRRMEVTAPMKVDAVSGSYMVCRASDFDEIGGFDTNLFLYYEEKDLSYRIKKELGREIFFLPEAKYIHLKGKSSGKSFHLRRELKLSQFYAMRKNMGTLKYLIFYLINFLKFLIKAPFNDRNRQYLLMSLQGMSLSLSLKYKQKIQPYINWN